MSEKDTADAGGIPVTGWLHKNKVWTLGEYGHQRMSEDHPDVAEDFEPLVRQAAVVDLESAMRELLLAFDNSESRNHDRSPNAAAALASAKQAMGLDPDAPMPRAKALAP